MRRHRVAAAAAISIGLALGVLSTASLVSSLLSLEGATALHRLKSGQALHPAAAAHAARASIRASRWFESGRHLSDAALAISAVPNYQRRELLGETAPLKVVVERSLRRAPTSPHNWTRLSLEWLAAGRPDRAAGAWQMAVLTGRYVPGLMLVRLDTGFQVMSAADSAQVELLGDQVRLVAELDPRGLASVARQRNALPFVRAALTKTPDLLARVEHGLPLVLSERAG